MSNAEEYEISVSEIYVCERAREVRISKI